MAADTPRRRPQRPERAHRPAADPVEHYASVSLCFHRSGEAHARLVYADGTQGRLITEAIAPPAVRPGGTDWRLAALLDAAATELACREAQLELGF